MTGQPLPRRGVVLPGLISGFSLGTHRVEAQAIHTDNAGLRTDQVRIGTDEGNLPAYYACPDRPGTFPIVVVIEDVFGVQAYIKDVCRRLAKLGYLAVATDYYARIGDLSKMSDPEQIMRDVILKAPDAQFMADIDATTVWAVANRGSSTRVGLIGFCRGGRQAWLYAAHSGHLKAAVAFYGPLGGPPSPIQPSTALEVAALIKCPMLGLYGGQDPCSPLEMVQQAEARAKAAHRIIDMEVYPDASHRFHADDRPSYRAADAEDAWKRTLGWLRRFGVIPAG